MVYTLAVFLRLKSSRRVLLAHKVIDNRLEYDIEVLCQQILPPVGLYIYLPRLVEVRHAQLPKPKCRIREILVLDGVEPNLPVALDVTVKPLPGYQLVAHVDGSGKPVLLMDAVQDGIEYDKQFFVEIHHPSLVDRF